LKVSRIEVGGGLSLGQSLTYGCARAYTVTMNGEASGFYNVPQAARILRVTLERVLELIREGDLKAHRSEQTGDWLIESRSVHARLKAASPPGPQELEVIPKTATSRVPRGAQQENHVLDSDLLVLLTIGAVTLLAAVYALVPALLGGESTQHGAAGANEAASTDAATGITQPETTVGTVVGPEKTTPASVSPPGWVSAVGDSVMLGAVDALQQKIPNLGLLNAQGSRQPPAATDILRQLRAADHLGDAVVVHVGNNGPFTDEQFDELMQPLAGTRKVLIVNLTVPPRVPDPIAIPNNTVLASGAQRYPNTTLVDWHAASANHPEFFGEDGIHLTFEGAQAYADLVTSYLQDTEGAVGPPGAQERITWGEGGSFGLCVGPSSWCIVPVTS
jgi:hypothetical protein